MIERPAPLSSLPSNSAFILCVDRCLTPATYDGCIDVRAVPSEALRAEFGLRAEEEAYSEAIDALRSAYRAEGRRVGLGHVTEGRYGARCNVTYVGAYRLWHWDPRPVPFAVEACQ